MSIQSKLDEIRKLFIDLDSEVMTSTANMSTDELCELLVSMHGAVDELKMIYSLMSGKVSAAMEDSGEFALADGSRIEKKWDTSRKGWKHKDLASVVATKLSSLAIDMDTGEIVMSPAEVAERILDYVQPSYWRVKALSEIGINVDNYCEVGETKSSIIVRKAK